ncbi:SWPV1-091 [Shearwaterpox virus]|uniref:SWPV1-091 n=1 Tax=Shearwaterpox virus TaxID=1974596 RepID=A0A1V0S7U0_CNPV|nr:SWPV1-091 [Shearwaterpox virus]
MEWPSISSITSVSNALVSSTLIIVMVHTNIIISTIFTLTLIVINYNTAYTVIHLYILSCVFDVNIIVTLFVGFSFINFISNYITTLRNKRLKNKLNYEKSYG